jgi:hypothetical protein
MFVPHQIVIKRNKTKQKFIYYKTIIIMNLLSFLIQFNLQHGMMKAAKVFSTFVTFQRSLVGSNYGSKEKFSAKNSSSLILHRLRLKVIGEAFKNFFLF